MKIDDLVKNLERNTAEQDKIIKKQAESVTKQHLESYNALLQKNLKQTESILEKNLQTIEDQQPSIVNALRLNTLKGAVLGVLVAIFLIFLGITAWLGKEIRSKQQELAELNLELERTPLENRILRMVEFHESEDNKAYFIVAKNAKKAEAYTTTGKDKVLKIER